MSAFLSDLHLWNTYCVPGPLLGMAEAGGKVKRGQGFSPRRQVCFPGVLWLNKVAVLVLPSPLGPPLSKGLWH